MASNTLKIDVRSPGGKKDGTVELPAELFDAPANIALMHQVFDLGVTLFDAADTYGNGRSEELIAKAFGGVQALMISHGTGPTQRKLCGRRLSK